jgi:hypothetical protein
MDTYTVPNPAEATGLMNIGPAGITFLGARGIAGGVLTDESPVVVDRAAMLIWMAWATKETIVEAMTDAELWEADLQPVEAGEDDWDTSEVPTDPDACHECAGAGRVLDGESCDGCGGSGKAPHLAFLYGDGHRAMDTLRTVYAITDPEYIGMTEPNPSNNALGYRKLAGAPYRNVIPLMERPYYAQIHDALMRYLADCRERGSR